MHTQLWLLSWRLILAFSGVSAADFTERAAGRLGQALANVPPRQLVNVPLYHVISGFVTATWPSIVGDIQAVTYIEQDDVAAVVGGLGEVQLWGGENGTNLGTFAAGAKVSSLTFLPIVRQVALGRQDGLVRMVDPRSRTIVGEVQANSNKEPITAIEYVDYEDVVSAFQGFATASFDESVHIWNAYNRELDRVFLLGGFTSASALRYVKPYKILVAGCLDGSLRFWSLPVATILAVGRRCTGAQLFLENCFTTLDCYRAAQKVGARYFSYGFTSGAHANTCNQELGDCSALVNDSYTVFQTENSLITAVAAHVGLVRTIELLPTNGLIATGGIDGFVKVWDPRSGDLKQVLHSFGSDPVLGLVYVPGVNVLVAGSPTQLAFIDEDSGVLVKLVPRTSSTALTFAPMAVITAHLTIVAPEGRSLYIRNVLMRCSDGWRPMSQSECELCPANLAGSGGECQIICESGNSSNALRTECAQCQPGSAGINGFCLPCDPGKFQSLFGRFSCDLCARGSAMPLSGMTSCFLCSDNTFALSVGQSVCVDCPDGTEPNANHTQCFPCPESTAGRFGSCFPCSNGEEPTSNRDKCIPCRIGTAGLGGQCRPCPDGFQPSIDRQRCFPCPSGFAGTNGLCPQCLDGEMQSENKSVCIDCVVGKFGTNGICTPCPLGFTPDISRVHCERCPGGQPSYMGVCLACEKGRYPAENLTECLICPEGYAGMDGTCDICPVGYGASEDKSRCLPCPRTEASSKGVCETCRNGTQPSSNGSSCEKCPVGRAGMGGGCFQCEDGFQQDKYASACELCPYGRAGVGGVCIECPYPLMQNLSRTSCTLQLHPLHLHFELTGCAENSVCALHFQHLAKFSEQPGLYCCPTLAGDPLFCCEFETPAQADFWEAIAMPFNTAGAFLHAGGSMLTFAIGAGILLVGGVRVFRRRSWSEWKEEHLSFSWRTLVVVLPLAALVFVSVAAWLLATCVMSWWMAILAIVLLKELVRMFFFATNESRFLQRQEAMLRLKWLLPIFALCDFSGNFIIFVVDWLIIRFLLADASAALGLPIVLHTPGEAVVDWLLLPTALKSPLRILVLVLRWPQVTVANVVTHIDAHAAHAAVTIFVAGSGALALVATSYVLLASNLMGRLVATQQAILLAEDHWRRTASLYVKLGFLDFILCLGLRWISLWPARFALLLFQLLRLRGIDTFLVDGQTLLFALFVQVAILCLWAAISSGRHVGDPPACIARRIEYYALIRFDSRRRKDFMVRLVLQALGLWNEIAPGAASEASGSRGGTPRSSPRGSYRTSPRRSVYAGPRGSHGGSPRGSSPRGSSPRGGSPRGSLHGSPRFVSAHPRKTSPRSTMSPRLVQTFASPDQVRMKKKLGSATAALKRAGGEIEVATMSRGLPPMNTAGSRTARSARFNLMPGKHVNFVRLPNGKKVSLPNIVHRNMLGTASRTSASPDRFSSWRGSRTETPPSSRIGSRAPGSPRSARMASALASSASLASLKRMGSKASSGSRSPRSVRMASRQTSHFPAGSAAPLANPKRMGSKASSDSRSPRSVRMAGSQLSHFALGSPASFTSAGKMGSIASSSGTGRSPTMSRGSLRSGTKGRCELLRLLCGKLRRCKRRQMYSEEKVQELRTVESVQEQLKLDRFDREIERVNEDGTVEIVKFVDTLKIKPQVLYDRLPQVQTDYSFRSAAKTFRAAVWNSLWTALGQWGSWSVDRHHVRNHTRNLTAEAHRTDFDQDDYTRIQFATAQTMAASASWLPCFLGAMLAVFMTRLNQPPLRHWDRSLDIARHKVDELLELGMEFKRAEISVQKSWIRNFEDEQKHRRAQKYLRHIRVLNLVVLALLVIMCVVPVIVLELLGGYIMGVVIICLLWTALLRRCLLPRLILPSMPQISTARETTEERKMRSFAQDELASSSSSSTCSDSTAYSSALDSWLEEDATKEIEPTILGFKHLRIMVRPKNQRLKLRLELLRAIPECQRRWLQYRQQDTLKHGRLMQLEGIHSDVMRPLQTFGFTPTEENDTVSKTQLFKLNRSRSLGTITAKESYEYRLLHEQWAGYLDIFEEHGKPGVPSLPDLRARLPNRGLVDRLEAQKAFVEFDENEVVTNKDLLVMVSWNDSALINKMRALAGYPEPLRPWEDEFDEALQSMQLPPPSDRLEAGYEGGDEMRSAWRQRLQRLGISTSGRGTLAKKATATPTFKGGPTSRSDSSFKGGTIESSTGRSSS